MILRSLALLLSGALWLALWYIIGLLACWLLEHSRRTRYGARNHPLSLA